MPSLRNGVMAVLAKSRAPVRGVNSRTHPRSGGQRKVLEMAKKLRPVVHRDQDAKADASQENKAGGGPVGTGGHEPYVNERGEICIGNECFNLTVDAERGEVRVEINRDECGSELQETLDQLHQVLGRGARTVYETKSTQIKS